MLGFMLSVLGCIFCVIFFICIIVPSRDLVFFVKVFYAIMLIILAFNSFIVGMDAEMLFFNPPMDIEKSCESNNISYTLVQTISEHTGVEIEEVYTLTKYAAAAEVDLDQLILLVKPILTKEQANAIITIADMKSDGVE